MVGGNPAATMRAVVTGSGDPADAGSRYFLSATILTPPRTCAPMRSTRRT